MDKPQPGAELPEPKRKQIFKALVEAQDQKMSVSKSVQVIASRFRISEADVKQIQEEGLEASWPPIGRH